MQRWNNAIIQPFIKDNAKKSPVNSLDMNVHPQIPAEAPYLLLEPQRRLHKESEPQSSPSSPDLALLYGWAVHTHIDMHTHSFFTLRVVLLGQ